MLSLDFLLGPPPQRQLAMVQLQKAISSDDDDDSVSDGGSFVVVAASSAPRKRKRDRTNSRSSLESAAARPSKHAKQLPDKHKHAANGSARQPAAQVRKGGNGGSREQNVATRYNGEPDDEDSDSDTSSIVVTAVSQLQRPISKLSKAAPSSQNGKPRPSPSVFEASGSRRQAPHRHSQPDHQQFRHPTQKRSSLSATHQRVESLAGQDLQDRIQSRKGKERAVYRFDEEETHANGGIARSKRVHRSATPEQSEIRVVLLAKQLTDEPSIQRMAQLGMRTQQRNALRSRQLLLVSARQTPKTASMRL